MNFNDVLRKIVALTPEDQKRYENILKTKYPEQYKQFQLYLASNPGAPLEAMGYEPWLRRLGPHTFTGEFAWFHHDFWRWYWPLAIQVQDKEKLNLHDVVCLLPWARDTGKSSHTEWAAIAEGALVRRGYVLWVSAKQQQAEEHVASIRDRIESEKVGKLYPWLSKAKVGAHGNKFGWGKEFLLTAGGWAVRPAGLDAYLRGGKVLDMRPTLIVLSDIDEIGDSLLLVSNKEKIITRSILPMGDADTRIIFDQNPIHAGSVMNRILTRASSALAVRRVIGLDDKPIPAFKDVQIEFQQTDLGPRHIIIGGTPTWQNMDMAKCQAFLDRSGYEAFMAEYQHSLDVAQEERVLPEYDDRVTMAHVITWDQFFQKYGIERIPSDWPADCGLDIGYTIGHKSSWTFLTKVPDAYELAGSIFRYRGCTFTNVSIDDQSVEVRSKMWTEEVIERERISHEKRGEWLLLNNKHGWHFLPCDSDKNAGLAQWRHYLRRDRTQPHPFHRDEKGEDGLWKIGRPSWFDIVVSSQFRAPVDDLGLKRHRDGAYNWRKVPVKLTEKGLTVEQPAKIDDDENDSTRSLLAGGSFGPAGKSITPAQRIQATIPQGYHRHELMQTRHPNDAEMTSLMAEFLAKKQLGKLKPIEKDWYGQRI